MICRLFAEKPPVYSKKVTKANYYEFICSNAVVDYSVSVRLHYCYWPVDRQVCVIVLFCEKMCQKLCRLVTVYFGRAFSCECRGDDIVSAW